MDTADERLIESAKVWTPRQWREESSKITENELVKLIPLASPLFDAHQWAEKLHILLNALNENGYLQSAGKMLSTEQFLDVFKRASQSEEAGLRQRLPPLFVGMSQSVFFDLLFKAPQEQIALLKHEAATEAIQHHLSLLSHDLKARFDHLCYLLVDFNQALMEIEPESMGVEDFKNIYRSADGLYLKGLEIIHVVGNALSLAWNTNRADLIQEFSLIKERCHRCLVEDIGRPQSDESPAAGLWEATEQRLSRIFSDTDANGEATLMKDSVPAIEALVKFSVWYLKDYYDIGLLPQITDPNELNTERMTSEDEREKLFALAEKKLAESGLKTLFDLKRQHIYSKRALKEHFSLFQGFC